MLEPQLDVGVEQRRDELEYGKIFKEVTAGDVFEMVLPEGVCHALDEIRINDESLVPSGDIGERWKSLWERADTKVDEMRGYFRNIIKNDHVLSTLLSLDSKEELSERKIGELLGLGDGYQWDVKRLYLIINKGVDPVLLPLVIESYIKERNLPEEITDVLSSNYRLWNKLTGLFTDPSFSENFGGNRGEPYPDEVKKRINDLIVSWDSELKKLSSLSDEDRIRCKEALGDFFNLEKELWHQNEKNGYEKMFFWRETTARSYLKIKSYNNGSLAWREGSFVGSNMAEMFKRRAVAVEKGKYLIGLYRFVEKLFENYFPEIALKGVNVRALSLEDPKGSKGRYKETKENCELAKGFWRMKDGLIGIGSGSFVEDKSARELLDDKTFGRAPELLVDRKVGDFLTMVHEYAHAIYSKIVREGKLPKDYKETADHAITEGFSVLMEYVVNDFLCENPYLLGWTQKNIEQAKRIKKQRNISLQEHPNGYTEGSYRILYRIYGQGFKKSGADRNKKRSAGLKIVRRFIETLDYKKIVSVRRDSDEYKQALKQGDVGVFRELFSK